MSSLGELRATLTAISRPDAWLRLADKYLDDFEQFGQDFVLPKEHRSLAPALEYYVGDLAGWVAFVRSVRDRLEPRSAEYAEVHSFYKTLNVRAIQRRTRALVDVATSLAVKKKLLPDTWDDKQRYAKRCIQAWKLRKDRIKDAVRRESPTGRVSASHRERLLKEFWDTVAEEVNNGEIPKP